MKLNVMRFAVVRRIRAMPAGEREGPPISMGFQERLPSPAKSA